MNPILLVFPILTLLMFDLGLSLEASDFKRIFHRPKAALVGLTGQLILLPLLAFMLTQIFSLPAAMAMGLVLIACCPGGSSSNVFSRLAGGDVALSVSMTAVSSIVTLFTLPLIMNYVVTATSLGSNAAVSLPVGNLLMQNVVVMLAPILLGLALRRWRERWALRVDAVLSRIAFPALMLLAGIFFVQHRVTISDNFGSLGLSITALILVAAMLAMALSWAFRLGGGERRTIVIEVAMQNAAQAIAIASSPFVFNDSAIAIPAIIYALMMNVVLLTYVGVIKYALRK